MPKADYETRRAEKQERLEELAEKNHAKATAETEQAMKMADVIPFGQPILVGHHSEKADRNYRKRIDNKMRKSIETGKKADYYDGRVKSMETNYAISADDPEAVVKIKEKIAGLEQERARLKAMPKTERDYSFSDADMRSVHLGSVGGEIRRLVKRLETMEKQNSIQAVEESNKETGISFEVNKDENRVMIFFPGKPAEEIRKALKHKGFRWSPRNSAWQAFIHDYTVSIARSFMNGKLGDLSNE